MKLYVITIMVGICLLGCAPYIELQDPVAHRHKLLKSIELKHTEEAIEYAEKYKISDYKYMGINMFRPYNADGKHPISVDRGFNTYHEKGEGIFPNKYVGVNQEGLVITVTGMQSFREYQGAKHFLSEIVGALQLEYPYLRERDSSLDDYSVWFLPMGKYIERYVSHWNSADHLEQDYQFGYKSSFWYLGNFMADDKLKFLSVSVKEANGLFNVIFHVESHEASDIATSAREKEIQDISREILY